MTIELAKYWDAISVHQFLGAAVLFYIDDHAIAAGDDLASELPSEVDGFTKPKLEEAIQMLMAEALIAYSSENDTYILTGDGVEVANLFGDLALALDFIAAEDSADSSLIQ